MNQNILAKSVAGSFQKRIRKNAFVMFHSATTKLVTNKFHSTTTQLRANIAQNIIQNVVANMSQYTTTNAHAFQTHVKTKITTNNHAKLNNHVRLASVVAINSFG